MAGGGRVVLLLIALALLAAAPAHAFDPAREQRNYSKTGERFEHDQANAEWQLGELTIGLDNMLDLIGRDVREGDRLSLTLCASGFNGCAGDIRLYDYQGRHGIQVPLVFANRNGALLEGHVWLSLRTLERYQRVRTRVTRLKCTRKKRRGARRRCTRKRRTLVRSARVPGVVIETGSVQAPERLYWWAAQSLAAHGYIVMSFDVQGQGRSDTFGHEEAMFEGVPAQQTEVFTGGLVDALDLFNSTRKSPYEPRGETGARRQQEEAAAGRATAFNPLHRMLDRGRLGIVGHSLGASSVSFVQETDERVDAVVAWDNLSLGGGSSSASGGGPPIKPRVPALGMSADYGLVYTPHTRDPDPQAKNRAFQGWKDAGVDVMQVNIRGGTHYEWSYISNPVFGATLRGIDMSAWYTAAWLDRYVKGDPDAERRLLTRRWHEDAPSAAIDPDADPNMFSFYFPSRAAFGGKVCDDIRGGCEHLVADDGQPRDPPYSVLNDR